MVFLSDPLYLTLSDPLYPRDSLHSHEKELERTSHNIKELIKEVKGLVSAAKALSRAQRSLSEHLITFKVAILPLGDHPSPSSFLPLTLFSSFPSPLLTSFIPSLSPRLLPTSLLLLLSYHPSLPHLTSSLQFDCIGSNQTDDELVIAGSLKEMGRLIS